LDRPIAYTQEQGRSTDFLFAQRSTMIAIAKLSQAVFGSNTVVRGLAVTPNSPAALNVLVGIGEIYTLASVDATTYGSLPADTTDQIVQQGLNMAAQTISTPAPTTAGYSINYLIEAQFQSQDTNPVVLPFYNSANPQQPLNGQGGGGATLPTERQGVCVIQAKAGIAATTGTQVTPSVDSGWTALAVVTVANGQVSVGAGNISIPAGVPQITSLLQMMQTDATNYAGLAGGTANAITATLSPAPASYSDYLLVTVRVANTNTGSVSLNVNGLGAVPVIGLGHQVLQGGELLAGGFATFAYSTNYSEAILLESTGGAMQVAPATASQHAVQFGQVFPSISATVAANALTGTLLAPTALAFRNPTLTSGTPVVGSIPANLTLTVPSGATLGTANTTSARLIWLVAYNGGSPVLCVVNLNGAPNLDETTLISPTIISAGATTAGTVYSASAVSANSPFRVVGFTDITEATAGTWATGPTTVQACGGQTLASMSSLGFGQTWQNLLGSRAVGTTYVNTTGKPIVANVAMTSSASQSTATLTVNGVTTYGSSAYNSGAPASTVSAIVPPGASYVAGLTLGTPTLSQWVEMR